MKICIYGAAQDEIPEIYLRRAEEFGHMLARRGHSLIFGGGAYGVMGAVARGVVSEGGEAVAVTPEFLNQGADLAPGCTQVIRTADLAERKRLFGELADAFVVLPGGIGTLDEYYEMYELASFGKLKKPVILYNMEGYYDLIDEMNRRFVEQGFLPPERAAASETWADPEQIFQRLELFGE